MPLSGNHRQSPHCLIFDPIPFNGGSKMASYEIVRQSLKAGVRFTVLSCDPKSWYRTSLHSHDQLDLVSFTAPRKLALATKGWAFWCKQLYFWLLLSRYLLTYRGVTQLAGISGPGVDMALYGCHFLFRLPVIQFIHGPVAESLSIGYCLTRANKTFFLESCLPSMKQAMSRFLNKTVHQDCGDTLAEHSITPPRYVRFSNGLSEKHWPTPCSYKRPRLFWAASTLKWKGLDQLLEAIRLVPDKHKLHCDICYIRPNNIALAQSEVHVNIPNVSWYEQPHDLDHIRAQCSLFVSTSKNEPFGLSILEALAAGLCVLIPSDNAYWDTHLTHEVTCIKYSPESTASLVKAITELLIHPERIQRIGMAGQHYAKRYRAETCYHPIVTAFADQDGKVAANNPTRQLG